MTHIHVCPLSKIPATVRETGARSLLTLINEGTRVPRPREIDASRHLFVSISDIVVAQDGHILPAEEHVAQVIDFVRGWDRREPLVIHCYAGVSRSTAAAISPPAWSTRSAASSRSPASCGTARRRRRPTRFSSPWPTPC